MGRKFFTGIAFSAIVSFLFSCEIASAQKVAIGTNLGDWASLGTGNLSVSVAVARNVTVGITGMYNPWNYAEGKPEEFRLKNRGGSLEVRYWPWHVYSGWWVKAFGRVTEYNIAGILPDHQAEQGLAAGGGLGVGYSLMLGDHFNVDFGLSGWGGSKDYTRFDCPKCGYPLEKGKKGFIGPDQLTVAFYVLF